jgi:hypothetical protein
MNQPKPSSQCSVGTARLTIAGTRLLGRWCVADAGLHTHLGVDFRRTFPTQREARWSRTHKYWDLPFTEYGRLILWLDHWFGPSVITDITEQPEEANVTTEHAAPCLADASSPSTSCIPP